MENTKIGLYILILYITVQSYHCDPSWGNQSCSLPFPESTAIGEWLFNLTASTTIAEFQLVFSTDSILTDGLVNLTDPWLTGSNTYTVGIILKSELDRDFSPGSKQLRFKVEDSANSISRLCTIFVTDVNDNAPIFLNLPYNSKVLEDMPGESVVFDNITVYDPDSGSGGTFAVSMVPDVINDEQFSFHLIPGSGITGASIKLKSTLDYEVRNSYTVIISAVDNGGLSSSVEVIITVADVQDTPPYFLQPVYRAAVKEHSAINIPVIQIQAEDGDRGNPRNINYKIIKGRTEFFAIHETTGIIIQTVSLDRDDAMMREINGVFDLTIQANEVNAIAEENATSEVQVTVTIEDINDNTPTFNTSSTYTAYVRDDTPPDSLIYFDGEGYMKVYDLDQGLNAYFTLSIEKDGMAFPALQPSPAEVFFEAFVLIRIINSSIIREYSGQHLAFDIIARETRTEEKLSSTAAVVLTIKTTEEPTTTPPPPEDDALTAPDIVVFVVGFLVLLNIGTSVSICFLMSRKKKNQSQGLARNGSKYYVTVTPKRPGLAVNATEGNSNGMSSTSVMQEIP